MKTEEVGDMVNDTTLDMFADSGSSQFYDFVGLRLEVASHAAEAAG